MKIYFFYIIFFLLIHEDVLASINWNQRASFMGSARHRASGFSIGNKGYVGGGHINSGSSVYHKDWWQYDPASDSWTQIADFGGGYRYHSSAFSIGEFGYVGLGEDNLDNYTVDFWKYIPQINIWIPLADYPGSARRGAACFVIDEYAYVGIGQSDGGYEVDFYKYYPNLDSWSQISDFLGEARSSAVSFSHNGKGYLGTGHIWGDDTRDFYEYDPMLDVWTQKADVGTTNRQDATGFVVNGIGYIGTGNDVDGNDNYDDFWAYNFISDTWTQIDDFEGEGRRYMVSFVIDNIAYAGGGTDGINLNDFWSFNPILNDNIFEEKLNVNVYPNPSNDFARICLPQDIANSEGYIIIYNINGQSIFNSSIMNNPIMISKSDIGTGTFFYIIQLEGELEIKGNFTIQ